MPQKESAIIRSLVNAAIPLDSIVVNDLDTNTSQVAKDSGQEGVVRSQQLHKDIGTNYPFITINNYVFNPNEIESFEIDYTDFIPTVRMVVGVKGKTFGSEAIPKDGDIVSIFIRAKNNSFKPIRNDYRITDVSQSESNSEGMNSYFRISGELFVPHLYDPQIISYKGTSYEVLKTIAKELNLGFASNDTATNDSQTWINPGGDYKALINDIARHAWKDEKSFFHVFIDVYYHLNFINVNNQFSESNELDLQLLTNLNTTDSIGGQTSEKQVEEQVAKTTKVLTNLPSLKGSAAFIHSYNLKNNSNFISQAYGYKMYTQFFEQNSEQYWTIYTDPLTTEGAAENKIILKGRTVKPGAPKEEYYKTQVKYVWNGIQYSAPEGNAHEKYNYAKDWNKRNNAELEKMKLVVTIERGNFNIYRGERIPLFLMVLSDPKYQNIAAPPEANSKPGAYQLPIPDKFYSGYYMVSGMKFKYSPTAFQNPYTGDEPTEAPTVTPGFIQEIVLTRREWPTPV